MCAKVVRGLGELPRSVRQAGDPTAPGAGIIRQVVLENYAFLGTLMIGTPLL